MTLAEKLRHLISTEQGASYEDIARRCGWPKGNISNLLRGKGRPQHTTTATLSRVLRVPQEYWSPDASPKDYLGLWLNMAEGRREELLSRPQRERLRALLDELDRAWPKHDLLQDLSSVSGNAVLDYVGGDLDLSDKQLQEVALALGVEFGFLDKRRVGLSPGEEHKYRQIIETAAAVAVTPQELLMVTHAVALSKAAGQPITEIISRITAGIPSKR